MFTSTILLPGLKLFQLTLSTHTLDGIKRVECLRATTKLIETAVWRVQKLFFFLVRYFVPFRAFDQLPVLKMDLQNLQDLYVSKDSDSPQ